MQRPARAIPARRSPAIPALRALGVAALGFLVIASSLSAGALGFSPQPFHASGDEARTPRTREKAADENARKGTPPVTVFLRLDDDGPIVVRTPGARLRIEKAQGDDVSVTVEKQTFQADSSCVLRPTDPVTIELARDTTSARLRATVRSGRRGTPSAPSLRGALTERWSTRDGPDILDRLTGALWRAFGREALRWLTH